MSFSHMAASNLDIVEKRPVYVTEPYMYVNL